MINCGYRAITLYKEFVMKSVILALSLLALVGCGNRSTTATPSAAVVPSPALPVTNDPVPLSTTVSGQWSYYSTDVVAPGSAPTVVGIVTEVEQASDRKSTRLN